ncbi:hypothetical protein [uncultured Desulfobacter sp.]|uniref:hypothetical protein n=1 Tax=uncultured Desulfobacter sp. TaxID=240139 RepID=UPI0029F5917B|nr:hypothetical protein [uncultured Desulfobacter sp.]
MSFTITEWNLNPNRNWYVYLSDSGSDISVELYTTQANADAKTNLVASGSGSYGSGTQIILTMDAAGTPEISLFNADLDYHVAVTGQSGDLSTLFHLAPFVDLDEINNGIYQSTALIQARALHEINTHTHISKERSIDLAGPFPEILLGDVLQVQSGMRGIDVLTTVTEITITGTPDSLTAQVETVEYVDMVYNG